MTGRPKPTLPAARGSRRHCGGDCSWPHTHTVDGQLCVCRGYRTLADRWRQLRADLRTWWAS